MTRRALITGITGQDGSYMADFLLSQGYEVYGLVRRNSSLATERIDYLYQLYGWGENSRLKTMYADLTDGVNMTRILSEVKPDEIYNFAAQSHVKISFEVPEYTVDVDGLSVLRLIEAMRQVVPEAKFYQAGTSEMFGNNPPPQTLSTRFDPESPYASAKCFAYNIIENFKHAYGLHAINGIAFNHESPRRGKNFVTKKIVDIACQIKNNQVNQLRLGNLTALRDWGYAPEYIVAIWQLTNLEKPINSTIATGTAVSVLEFAEHCFGLLDLKLEKYLEGFSSEYLRFNEVNHLQGDSSEIASILKRPIRVSWRETCEIMIEASLNGKEKNIIWENFL